MNGLEVYERIEPQFEGISRVDLQSAIGAVGQQTALEAFDVVGCAGADGMGRARVCAPFPEFAAAARNLIPGLIVRINKAILLLEHLGVNSLGHSGFNFVI